MRTLSVELDEETVRKLEVERRLIGFESRSEYVSWIIEHRSSIDRGTGAEPVVGAYGDRIAELEARLAAIEARAGESEAAPGPSPTSSGAGASTDESAVETPTSSTSDCDVEPGEPGHTASADGGWTTASVDGATAEAVGSDGAADADGGICAKYLRPERVERVRDETLAADAGVLGSVEGERLDELSRRAVAETRERLNREVETGLEYRSSTSLAEAARDVRPGEDLADLDSIDVPGHDEAIVERRRELVGRALAYLRDEGSARKSDLVDALYDEHSAGYDSTGGWWRCLKGALKQVDAVDGGDGSRIWRYEG